MGGSEAGAHSRGRVFLSSYLWKHSCRHIFSGELSGEDSTAHQPTAFIFSGWEIVNQDFSQSENCMFKLESIRHCKLHALAQEGY